jgi:hypothetical protein
MEPLMHITDWAAVVLIVKKRTPTNTDLTDRNVDQNSHQITMLLPTQIGDADVQSAAPRGLKD